MYMRDVKPPQRAVEEVLSVEDADRLILCLGGGGETHYTSETMEEDFSISVELLTAVVGYLQFLRDLQKQQGFLSEKQEDDFKELLDRIEEFTGQWG